MKTYEEIVKECNAKIPRDVISTREGGNGKKLDYLAGYYVIDRLNEVFGQGHWSYTSDAYVVHTGTVTGKYGDVFSVHYTAKVRLVANVGGQMTEFTDYGYGDGTDKTNIGKAHELAIKEAITDGIKRAARCLGSSFGNALYDKSGDGIDERESGGTKESPQASPGPSIPAAVQPKPSRETVLKSIAAASKVLVDKKTKTQPEVIAMLAAYGAKSKEELNDEQAAKLLAQLKEMLK